MNSVFFKTYRLEGLESSGTIAPTAVASQAACASLKLCIRGLCLGYRDWNSAKNLWNLLCKCLASLDGSVSYGNYTEIKRKMCMGTYTIVKNYLSSNKMILGNQIVSCTISQSRSYQRNDHRPTMMITREGMRMPEPNGHRPEAGNSMDNNLSLIYLTLDALKSLMPQSPLGKFTAVFPKLFESQWKTYEGQKKVS